MLRRQPLQEAVRAASQVVAQKAGLSPHLRCPSRCRHALQAKVVSSKNMWGCFSPEDLQQHRAVLADPGSSMQLLLNTLRKLDCYRLQPSDVSSSEIGRACATLAAYHPREVRQACWAPPLACGGAGGGREVCRVQS